MKHHNIHRPHLLNSFGSSPHAIFPYGISYRTAAARTPTPTPTPTHAAATTLLARPSVVTDSPVCPVRVTVIVAVAVAVAVEGVAEVSAHVSRYSVLGARKTFSVATQVTIDCAANPVMAARIVMVSHCCLSGLYCHISMREYVSE